MDEESERLARLWGIETSYFDVQGRHQQASRTSIERISAALSGSGLQPSLMPGDAVPEQAFQGDGHRRWIVAVQLYAVRSEHNWGHGDFTDLANLVTIAADAGASGIGLNPLHMLFPDRPEDASPYSPNSRLFLNPLYIDLNAIPEFSLLRPAEIAGEIERLRRTELVDYQGVAALKLPALRLAHRAFHAAVDPGRHRDFEQFRADRGAALARFAAFETLRQKFGGPWREWPEEWRAPDDAAVERLRDSDAANFGFHEFVQWIADRQLAACQQLARARGMAVGLYVDVAVGVDPDGADAWAMQDAMLRGLSAGAPPDEFNPAGQDWGLTSFDPHGLVRRQFRPWREVLRAAMRHAGAIRIDHVLGTMRLFVIPHGLKGQDGAYLRFPFAAMLRVVAEESRSHRCIVIGEDLGTVPGNFREAMHAWGLWSYLVMLFEREADGSFRRPERYRERALATFGTHDLPTLAGWISGHDLRTKRAIGVDPGESDEAREWWRGALRRAIGAEASVLQLSDFLARTPTRLVSVAIEDILELQDQVNVPGTVMQHPNWRRRLPVDVEDLASNQRLRAVATVFARSGRGAS